MWKIFRRAQAPVYVRTKRHLDRWLKNNPGEGIRWEELDAEEVWQELQRLADSLGEIASFSEGETVTSGFDCPIHAKEARIALGMED